MTFKIKVQIKLSGEIRYIPYVKKYVLFWANILRDREFVESGFFPPKLYRNGLPLPYCGNSSHIDPLIKNYLKFKND